MALNTHPTCPNAALWRVRTPYKETKPKMETTCNHVEAPMLPLAFQYNKSSMKSKKRVYKPWTTNGDFIMACPSIMGFGMC